MGAGVSGRVLCWVSTGAASMVAAKLELERSPGALLVRCETNNEDEDNYRFEADCVKWLGRPVTLIRSDKYASVREVWAGERYMSGTNGASCSRALKFRPRLEFQRPTDEHVFGYTADKSDVKRFETLRKAFFEMKVRAPLIERGITKAMSLALIERAGIRLPRSYAMGFPNANCLRTGCVKASSPDYWSLLRKHFPEAFAETAAQARALGCRLTRIKGERAFIDEIPLDQPTLNPIVPACDFLCQISTDEAAAFRSG